MRKHVIFLAVLVVGIMAVSCSDDADINQSGDSNVLGMVIPGTSTSESNAILLTDGRTINPVSGISNFSGIRPGKKYLLTFTVTGSRNDGSIDVNVNKCAKAENVRFASTARIANNDSIPSGTLTGTYYYFSGDSTVTAEGTTNIMLEDGNYTCSASPTGYPVGGSGTYTLGAKTISFDDINTWPADTNPDFILDGDFTYYIYNKKNVTFMRINDDQALVLYHLSLSN